MAEKATTKPPKGTRDFLPDEVRKRDHVTGIIREVYTAHGFEPIETPSFERLETLLGKYGEEGDQLVFKILQRGQQLVTGIREAADHLQQQGAVQVGRSGETAPGAEKLLADLGLRYDLTVPLARVYAEYQGKLPAVLKRYQMQPVWRADNPSKGRFREFWQCDVDVVGSDSRIVEAEVMGAVAECLKRLGFQQFDLRLNHRRLLKEMADLAGVPPGLETEAIIAIDKLDKVSADVVEAELRQKGISESSSKKLLEIVLGERDLASVRAHFSDHEGGQAAIADLEEVMRLVELTPAAEHVKFDPSLARGLGYYTGSVFEIAVPDLAGSLGGGGRYDNLIGMFSGKDVPACGFSIGLERILVVMEERKMYPPELRSVDVVLAATDKKVLGDALELSYRLRSAGLSVELRSKAEKAGKLRKYADDSGVPFAVWITHDHGGKAELWSKVSGEIEKDLAFDRLSERLR